MNYDELLDRRQLLNQKVRVIRYKQSVLGPPWIVLQPLGLLAGLVFVFDGVTSVTSAEIYDEATNTWTFNGSMNVGRGEFANVVLNDGRVLVMGGITELSENGQPIASAEIYDPVTGTWTLTGSMSTAREDHTAVRLLDGRVLVAGGATSEDVPRLSSAEIFDPNTGQWTPTGDMTTGRSEEEYGGIRLRDGRVLMPGLIDAHWHAFIAATPQMLLMTADPSYLQLLAARQAEATLMRGFTTVRDLGGPRLRAKARH